LHPYPLEITDIGYSFVTDQGLRYLLYFLEDTSLFKEFPLLNGNAFWFNIDNIEGSHDTAVEDERVAVTVFEVLFKFFAQQENVAIFVCDSVDGRQRARKRKFDQWFFKLNNGSLIKENGNVLSAELEYYSGMILHRNNPHLSMFLEAFRDLHTEMNNKETDS